MPELTREEKLKLVEKLPQRLQDFLYSEDTGADLLYLGQKYNLSDEKISLLSKLTGDVVLGIVPITSLAQEIASKITPDTQIATNLAQELYAGILAPILMPAPAAPAPAPASTTTPVAPAPAPAPAPAAPAAPVQPMAPITPTPAAISADRYREPISSAPEVVDLRKAPAPIIPKPIVIPPAPAPVQAPIPIPMPTQIFTPPVSPAAPAASLPTTPAPSAPLITAPTPVPAMPTPEPPESKPQYILRSSGAPPTNFSDNILDLRKDKGEF